MNPHIGGHHLVASPAAFRLTRWECIKCGVVEHIFDEKVSLGRLKLSCNEQIIKKLLE